MTVHLSKLSIYTQASAYISKRRGDDFLSTAFGCCAAMVNKNTTIARQGKGGSTSVSSHSQEMDVQA